MSRKSNYFSALDDGDEEERGASLFAPSILGGSGGGGAGLSQNVLSFPPPASARPLPAVVPPHSIDLQSVVAELAAAESTLPPVSAGQAWDFSAFTDASKAAQEQWRLEAHATESAKAEQKRLTEEHLARLHASDQDRMREQLQLQSASSKQNARRKAAQERAEAFTERLTGKASRSAAAKRRLNQAKNLY